MDYYKKIDKSVFYYGITIRKKYIDSFTFGFPLKAGESRDVRLNWKAKKKEYGASLIHIARKDATSVYQIRWDSNYELLNALRKEFIQSYIAIESKNYEAKVAGKYYVTDLLGGNQEVLVFRPLNISQVELETFIKISTPYDNLFKRLVEENVFGWLSKRKDEYLITKSTKWLNKDELKKHEDASFVVYYLIDEINKQIYIGSAKRLGDRVKPNRSEIPGWTKFKYEILHPDYHHLLKRVEFHAIRAFASFFKNMGKVQAYPVSKYTLVNKNWPRRG